MVTNLPVRQDPGAIVEKVVIQGDLSQLAPSDRVAYYTRVCESLGLNPLTKPFEYIELNGKLTLYAKRDATDQLRQSHKINVTIVSRETIEGVYVVTARATTPDGRTDESIGAVSITKEDGEWTDTPNGKRYFKKNGRWLPLRGDELANALMKAETKAKRRVTLSVAGLGWLDETEVETVPSARYVRVQDPAPEPPASPAAATVVDTTTGEIVDVAPAVTPGRNGHAEREESTEETEQPTLSRRDAPANNAPYGPGLFSEGENAGTVAQELREKIMARLAKKGRNLPQWLAWFKKNAGVDFAEASVDMLQVTLEGLKDPAAGSR